ncbi:ATP-dependent 6-phosphofructokinase, partial [bacterium]|nr:ATP-dependent 6-phosphofructokinase [bacterium]
MKRIGLLTSGTDAPGMNALIRAVVRTAESKKMEVIGISHGFKGIIEEQFKTMSRADTANIVGLGGTILK